MLHAEFTADPGFTVGEIDPRLFGSFLEHMGRVVRTGAYEPGHPRRADDSRSCGVASNLIGSKIQLYSCTKTMS